MTNLSNCQTFSRSEHTEHRFFDFDNDVDPENHVFNGINDSCRYYTDEKLNDRINLDKTFSLLHFNCRSLLKNFTKISEYLETFKVKLTLSNSFMHT